MGNDQQACRLRFHHPDDLVNAGAFNGDRVRAQPAGSQVIRATLQDEAPVSSFGRFHFREDSICCGLLR
jgi:hypothetical protein